MLRITVAIRMPIVITEMLVIATVIVITVRINLITSVVLTIAVRIEIIRVVTAVACCSNSNINHNSHGSNRIFAMVPAVDTVSTWSCKLAFPS